MRAFIVVIALMVLAGCASQQTQQFEYWAQAEQARQIRLDTLAASCETDLCLVMVAQEGSKGATPLPRQQVHPAWSIVDKAISMAVPAYFGMRQADAWAGALVDVTRSVASIDRAYTDNSTNIGRDNIGGDRIDDSSTHDHSITTITNVDIGGSYAGQDQYQESCSGANCRYDSAGPYAIDQSDNSSTDNSDRSTTDSRVDDSSD